MEASVKQRVARGAKMLDKLVPGWARKVKLSTLDFGTCANCVAGQLEINGGATVRDKMIDAGLLEYPAELGFDTGGYDYENSGPEGDYEKLTDAWKDEIRARRR